MNWLVEQPLTIGVTGGILLLLLGAIWLQTGHKSLLYALAAIAGLTLAALLLERLVTTDHERIRDTLDRIADDIESNQLDRVLTHVHPDAAEIRAQAVAEFPRYRFDRASIKQNLEIEPRPTGPPREIVARFNAVVVLSDKTGMLNNRQIPRFVIATFREDGGQWKVVHYEHHDPREGFRREP